MKILYGVQGTGNGHITRARAMAAEMHAAGVEVDFVFSGR
jgi:UDP:flavonoid glycosyltransferase YjiC (YdhE family)